MLVVRANEDRSNPADIANLIYVDEGVSLLRITDDDGMVTMPSVILCYLLSCFSSLLLVIVFQFEFEFYSFSESAGTLTNAINVIKQEGAISEQNLTLFADHVPSTAMFGKYMTCVHVLGSNI